MDIVQTIIMVTGVVVALLALVATKLGFWKWLAPQAKSWGEAVDEKTGLPVLGFIFEKGVAITSAVFQDAGPVLKEITADGKIDDDEWDQFFSAVRKAFVDSLVPAEIDALNKASNGNSYKMINGMIPHLIAESKRRGAGAKRADPSTP